MPKEITLEPIEDEDREAILAVITRLENILADDVVDEGNQGS